MAWGCLDLITQRMHGDSVNEDEGSKEEHSRQQELSRARSEMGKNLAR